MRQWQRYDQAYQHAPTASLRSKLEIGWDDMCQSWSAAITELNKLISDFNLKRPSVNTELYKLNLERELKKAGARRWLRDLGKE